MRLSDAGMRCCPTKLIDPDHRLPPWLTEDSTPRDRSNRLLEACVYISEERGGNQRFPTKFSTHDLAKAGLGSGPSFHNSQNTAVDAAPCAPYRASVCHC